MIATYDSFRLRTIYTLASIAVYRCCTTNSPMSRFRPYDLRQQTQGSSVLVLVTQWVTVFSDQLPAVSVPFTRDEEPIPLAFRSRCGQGAQDPYP